MPDDPTTEPRRRIIPIRGRAGSVEATALEFGPADRALDIIFLHANGFNAMTYRHVLAPLGQDQRILAVDLRGHGPSRLPTELDGHSWKIYADDLLGVIRSIGETPRIVAGHSMGATAALLALPKMTGAALPKLVLFDPVIAPRSSYGEAPDYDTQIARAALKRNDDFASAADAFESYQGRGAFRTWPDDMLRDYLEDGLVTEGGRWRLACTPQWEAANFAAYCVADPYPALDNPPTHISIFRAETNSTCHFDPGAPLLDLSIVPGTTHFLPMEKPEIVQQALN